MLYVGNPYYSMLYEDLHLDDVLVDTWYLGRRDLLPRLRLPIKSTISISAQLGEAISILDEYLRGTPGIRVSYAATMARSYHRGTVASQWTDFLKRGDHTFADLRHAVHLSLPKQLNGFFIQIGATLMFRNNDYELVERPVEVVADLFVVPPCKSETDNWNVKIESNLASLFREDNDRDILCILSLYPSLIAEWRTGSPHFADRMDACAKRLNEKTVDCSTRDNTIDEEYTTYFLHVDEKSLLPLKGNTDLARLNLLRFERLFSVQD